jgi:hypothetical protein
MQCRFARTFSSAAAVTFMSVSKFLIASFTVVGFDILAGV